MARPLTHTGSTAILVRGNASDSRSQLKNNNSVGGILALYLSLMSPAVCSTRPRSDPTAVYSLGGLITTANWETALNWIRGMATGDVIIWRGPCRGSCRHHTPLRRLHVALEVYQSTNSS